MKKRQAYEVIQEIEQLWLRRRGAMVWRWDIEHIAFLIKRWQFKRPQEQMRIKQVASHFAEYQQSNISNGMPAGRFYVFSALIREMMLGAEMQAPYREEPQIDNLPEVPIEERANVEATAHEKA